MVSANVSTQPAKMSADRQSITFSATFFILLITVALITAVPAAYAQTESLLYSFGPAPDGANPVSNLILDSKGDLFGTTLEGGADKYGTVFELAANGTETVLHNFPAATSDGENPRAGLWIDSSGNLYGTTYSGGTHNSGIVFELSPSGTEIVLYNFLGGKDGGNPEGGVILDASGNIYGTTRYGGANKGGTVYEISAGKKTILWSFGAGTDGSQPYGNLVRDSSGNLYGTTEAGGTATFGTVFKVTSSGSESILHSFAGGSDGANPIAGLIIDSQGNLFGTTQGGANGSSTIFKISSSGSESTIYGFVGADLISGSLVEDTNGNLYGTTRYGGAENFGSVFEVSQTGTETTLHSFQKAGRKDGYYPLAGLAIDGSGNLYGTASRGGKNANGALFKVTP